MSKRYDHRFFFKHICKGLACHSPVMVNAKTHLFCAIQRKGKKEVIYCAYILGNVSKDVGSTWMSLLMNTFLSQGKNMGKICRVYILKDNERIVFSECVNSYWAQIICRPYFICILLNSLYYKNVLSVVSFFIRNRKCCCI